MDAQRFDNLARTVAGNGSRRGLLRGLAGAAALLALGRRTRDASAQSGNLGPGDACYDDGQCSATVMGYSPLVCADNGLAYDGPFNCCTGEGGFCYGDEGCCGAAVCIDGSCITGGYTTSPAPPYNPSYARLGNPCQTNDQCFASGLVCDWVGATDDLRCCMYEGGGCGWDGQCCGWMTCGFDGTCGYTSSRPSTCTGYRCNCNQDDPYACDPGLYCCPSESGVFCVTAEECGIVACTGVGCTCVSGTFGACDDGLMCCAQGDPGALGVCLTIDTCYVSMAGCRGEGCQCAVQDPYACDGDFICCGPGEAGATGTCLRLRDC